MELTPVTLNNTSDLNENSVVEIHPIVFERIIDKRSILDYDISSVTVYLDKAEVCRTVPINIKNEETLELLIYQLSPAIVKDSIRIESNGAPIIIQDVTFHASEEIKSVPVDTERDELKETEKEAIREKESFLTKKKRLTKQRALLEKFADILLNQEDYSKNGSEIAIHPSVKSFAEAFDPKHLETVNGFLIMYENKADFLDEQILKTNEDIKNVDEILNYCEKRRLELDKIQENLKSRELSIFIEAKETTKFDLSIHYVVNFCSWKPFYDIRIVNSESQMKIVYYALISQNSLEDWKDIKQLLISTAQPPVGGTVPDIGIQKVFFKSTIDSKGNQPTLRFQTKLQKNRRMSKAMSFQEKHEKARNMNCDKGLVSELAEKDQNQCFSDDNLTFNTISNGIVSDSKSKIISNEKQEIVQKESILHKFNSNRFQKEQNKSDIPYAQYAISRLPELIASGGDTQKVVVGYIDLKPTFEYASVPKRVPFAYLKASSTNNSEYVIFPGEANIFIDSNFVGKTELKTVYPGEEFIYNLGADHRVQVWYHPMYKYREGSAALTKTICLTYKQVIVVLNNHSKPINMILMDQLPITNEDKIKISLQEPTIKHPEKYDKSKPIRLTKNSQVEWDLELGSGEKREITLKYTVEHPTGECLDLINE